MVSAFKVVQHRIEIELVTELARVVCHIMQQVLLIHGAVLHQMFLNQSFSLISTNLWEPFVQIFKKLLHFLEGMPGRLLPLVQTEASLPLGLGLELVLGQSHRFEVDLVGRGVFYGPVEGLHLLLRLVEVAAAVYEEVKVVYLVLLPAFERLLEGDVLVFSDSVLLPHGEGLVVSLAHEDVLELAGCVFVHVLPE